MSDLETIYDMVSNLSEAEKRLLHNKLRSEVVPHPLESEWHTDAETLMEAIIRSSDITKRNLKGIVAEASLGTNVIELLDSWEDITPIGDYPYDYLIKDGLGKVKIQVKLQRRSEVEESPIVTDGSKTGGYKFEPGYYIVEPQKTRTKIPFRLYEYGEFDILAVCLYPATEDWTRFHFTLGRWLLPHPKYPDRVNYFQPVSPEPNDVWTDDLETAIDWLRSGRERKIWTPQSKPLFG